MTVVMLALTFENAATMASVTSAAASAYSDSSSPLSSLKKFLPLTSPSSLRDGGTPRPARVEGAAARAFALLDVAGEIVDDAADISAQGREDPDDGECDEGGGDRVLRQFESALVAQEILKHHHVLLV